MAKTVAEELGTTFTYNGRSKVGREMNDAQLQWYAEKGPEALKGTALTLLEETVVTQGETGIVRVEKERAAKKPAAQPATPPDDWQTFDKNEEAQPAWAARLEAKFDKLIAVADALMNARKSEATAPAAGVGQGGGVLHIVKVKIEHKDGKVLLNFFDDDPNHEFPEIREYRPAAKWKGTIPTGFDISEERSFNVNWEVTYKLSTRTTAKGNPYKDVVSIKVNA